MDIRLRELEFLADVDRGGRLTVGPLSGSEKDLAAFLVFNGYVNDFRVSWVHDERCFPNSLPGESVLERKLHSERINTLSRVLGDRDVSLEITHAGGVRMAELRHALRSDKLREQHGILWDGRHFDMDLRVALLEASDSTPLAVAYFDLNGFKAVNDTMAMTLATLLFVRTSAT
jgi:hypothetical protein